MRLAEFLAANPDVRVSPYREDSGSLALDLASVPDPAEWRWDDYAISSITDRVIVYPRT